MGLQLRKRVSLGPFAFNLSGSGVSVSAGVPGFRVGSGPRGNYVRVGGKGIYYRQTIPATPMPQVPVPQTTALQPIDSVSATEIVDSTSEVLLEEIRAKRRIVSITPIVVVCGVLATMFALAIGVSAATVVFVLACIAAYKTSERDAERKTVVIEYDLEPAADEAFRRFSEWASALASTQRAWHVAAAGRVNDPKYHAGASELVQRNVTSLRVAAPPYVKTNVPVFSIGAGRQTLYFLPDKLLIYDDRGVGAIGYRTLNISAVKQRFIEGGTTPSDATVVDYTWRYVNRSGGPDRRFNNNPRLPICLYDELRIQSASGLNEVVQLSRSGLADGFVTAVRHLANVAGTH